MKPRILFVSHRIPYPPNKGDKIRSFHELEYLSRHYTVDLVTFIDDPYDTRYIKELHRYAASVKVYRIHRATALLKGILSLIAGKSLSEGWYASQRVQRYVNALLATRQYTFAFCFSSQVGQFLTGKKVPKILDFCDADSDKFRQYAHTSRFPRSALYRLEWKRLKKWEMRAYEAFDHSLIVTQAEARLFSSGRHLPKLKVIPNGIDTSCFAPMDVPKEKCLVFSGDMSYHANVDGALWFCSRVLPAIHERIPDLKVYIVGRNPVRELVRLGMSDSRIIVTGTVDDIRPYIARSLAAIVPLRIARGIQNKVLEAMAMGIAVIIPRLLLESLEGVREGEEVLAFEGEGECGEMCLKLMCNERERNALSRSGRAFVCSNYQWEKNLIWLQHLTHKA